MDQLKGCSILDGPRSAQIRAPAPPDWVQMDSFWPTESTSLPGTFSRPGRGIPGVMGAKLAPEESPFRKVRAVGHPSPGEVSAMYGRSSDCAARGAQGETNRRAFSRHSDARKRRTRGHRTGWRSSSAGDGFCDGTQPVCGEGVRVRALDYLTKPVEPERLQATLARVKERVASNAALSNQEQLKSVLEILCNGAGTKKEYPRRLLVPGGRKDSFVNVEEIEWIEAADYYCCLHVGEKNLMLRETIGVPGAFCAS